MPAPPVIDIRRLRDARHPPAGLVEAIDAACTEIGFFVVTGHGAEPQVDEIFAAAHRLFGLPQPVKESIAMVDREGFVPARHRVIDRSLHSAPAEYYDAGTRGAQRFPPERDLPGFEAAVRAYQATALSIAGDLLEVLARALALEPSFFADRMRAPQCFLRMMHYEPVAPAGDGTPAVLTDPHTDYGLVTLLATDGVAGLEVRWRTGEWSMVEAPPRSLVVNLGDMLARWTNDRYVSTPHRVVAPPGRERFSVPFFVNPDPDTTVSCLPSCVTPDRPCRYEPVTAGEFLRQRIAAGGYMDDDS